MSHNVTLTRAIMIVSEGGGRNGLTATCGRITTAGAIRHCARSRRIPGRIRKLAEAYDSPSSFSLHTAGATTGLFIWGMAKEFARQLYNSKAWKRCRAAYWQQAHGLCEECLKRGLYKPGEIVHHIVELTPTNIDDPRITLGFDNLELVCRECHAEKHPDAGWSKINQKRREASGVRKRFVIDENGKVFPI